MILSDKDLQLLSSMPQNDSENDRKDNDLKIGKTSDKCSKFNCFLNSPKNDISFKSLIYFLEFSKIFTTSESFE